MWKKHAHLDHSLLNHDMQSQRPTPKIVIVVCELQVNKISDFSVDKLIYYFLEQ